MLRLHRHRHRRPVNSDEAGEREISGNLCRVPECGPHFFNEVQAAAIFVFEAVSGSIISHHEVSDNDTGIAVAGGSGCCSVLSAVREKGADARRPSRRPGARHET